MPKPTPLRDLSRVPLRVRGRAGATYETVMADIGKIAERSGGAWQEHVERASIRGLVIVFSDGSWHGSGPLGHLGPADAVGTGIDREVG